MTYEQFHNALRVLLNIDRDEFMTLVGDDLSAKPDRFMADPYGWFIRAGDRNARKVFAEIQRRNSHLTDPSSACAEATPQEAGRAEPEHRLQQTA